MPFWSKPRPETDPLESPAGEGPTASLPSAAGAPEAPPAEQSPQATTSSSLEPSVKQAVMRLRTLEGSLSELRTEVGEVRTTVSGLSATLPGTIAGVGHLVRDEGTKIRQQLTAQLSELEAKIERELRVEIVAELVRNHLATVIDDADWVLRHKNLEGVDPIACVESLRSRLLSALAQLGVEPIAVSSGDPFDESRHEGRSRVPERGEGDELFVSEVERRGYMIDQRVLRRCAVSVKQGR